MTPLEERAMLVRLTIHQWYNRKTDSSVRNEVAAAKGATESEDEYRKVLVPRRTMAGIKHAVSALRSTHVEQTLPWGQDGARILPSSNFFDYCTAIKRGKQDLEAAVKAFGTIYPALVQQLQGTRGGLYNLSDYPTQEQIENAFGVDTTFLPFPTTKDFRLQGMDTRELRAEIEQEINDRLSGGVEDLRNRLYSAIERWVTTLSDPEKSFHETMLTNLANLVELAPRLNFTNDLEVKRLAHEGSKLLHYNIEVLRGDVQWRLQAAYEARCALGETIELREAA